MRSKKVLLSAYACSPTKGSEEGNGWNWALGLARNGMQVWCLTNVAFEKEIRAALEQEQIPNLNFVFVRLSGYLDRRFLNPDSKRIYLHYLLWRRKAARIALRMHTEIHFDIAHHITYGSLQQGNFIWRLRSARRIFGPVGGGQMAPAALKSYFNGAWKTEVLRKMISDWTTRHGSNFKRSLKNIDHLLVTNHDTFALAENTGYIPGKNIHFVPDHAVPPHMENLTISHHRQPGLIRLLWVGRILPRKGLNLVLHALSKLPGDINYQLTIVGGGEWFHLLPQWVREYELDEKRILATGQIPFAQVAAYYRKSDAFIFCTMRDSFPMQITEAMAFGLPVITLDIHGSACAVPEKCGIKIPVESREQTLSAIAEAITLLYNDEALRSKLAENAVRHIRENTWQHRIDSVVGQFYFDTPKVTTTAKAG